MVTFFGIDLAWSQRNRSGLALIEGDAAGGRLRAATVTVALKDILAFVDYYAANGPAIIGVDAPLWVPNESGQRLAETELNRMFRRYEAGAHPSNRRLLERNGTIRGEDLVTELGKRGVVHRAAIAAGIANRQVTEVFPHPAMVAIFGLDRTLKYKPRPKRSLDERLAAWRSYQAHLLNLETADPPLQGLRPLLAVEPASLRPAVLKRYEDLIDAVFCAYIGLYAFRWGERRCRVFGSMEEGYIFTAVPSQQSQPSLVTRRCRKKSPAG
jgi:predicted RNase H-like nuclease